MIDLALGPDVIERLIPHRRPFAMVDRVVAFARSPRPALRTQRHISANEPVFEGHFPGIHLWPGVYTIEGLGQTANLLLVLEAIVREYEARASTLEAALEDLRLLEHAHRLSPGHRPERAKAALERLVPASAGVRGAVAAAVDVKFLRPVFAGQRLDYEVVATHLVESVARFEVVASVDGQDVAKGVLKGAVGVEMPEGAH
jgi:3-hydroxyacyl-[acyl-carrier-protein] dehydratase